MTFKHAFCVLICVLPLTVLAQARDIHIGRVEIGESGKPLDAAAAMQRLRNGVADAEQALGLIDAEGVIREAQGLAAASRLQASMAQAKLARRLAQAKAVDNGSSNRQWAVKVTPNIQPLKSDPLEALNQQRLPQGAVSAAAQRLVLSPILAPVMAVDP